MKLARVLIAYVLLLTTLFMGIVPAYAQWLCVDPDGSISFETDESKAVCCEHWQQVGATEDTNVGHDRCLLHGKHDCQCQDYAIGTGSKTIERAVLPSFAPTLALLPPPAVLVRILISQDFSPRWLHPATHALDSPALSRLKTIVILI